VGASCTPGSWCPCTGRGRFPYHGRSVTAPAFSTQNRRRSHRFRRPSLTKPHRKFTCVHPSDLPLARFAWMDQVPLGLHPSAVARFVAWHLQGSGTCLDTGCSVTTSHAHSIWCNIASRAPLRTGLAPFNASGSPVDRVSSCRLLASHLPSRLLSRPACLPSPGGRLSRPRSTTEAPFPWGSRPLGNPVFRASLT